MIYHICGNHVHLRTTRYAEIVEDSNIVQNTVILKDEGKKEIRGDERREEGRGGEMAGERCSKRADSKE